MQTTVNKTSYKYLLTVFILTSIAVVLFLFFIDEGRNSFEGAIKPVHLLTFFIYAIPTVLSQFLMYRLLTKLNIQSGKLFFSIIIGLFLGIIGVISLFYLIK